MSKPAGLVVRAGDWQVQSVPTHGEVLRFLRAHHYARGGPKTAVYRHGMYRDDPDLRPFVGELVGVALWLPPTQPTAASVAGDEWRGVLCLSRLALAPKVGTNGASFLLGRSMRLIDRSRWPWLVTFADTGRGHTGAIYKATNWTCLGPVAARDTWTAPDGTQRGQKRTARFFTPAEMIAAGFTRNDRKPKIKFVHQAAA